MLLQTPSVPAPVATWQGLITTFLIAVAGSSAVSFFVARTLFSRSVMDVLEDEKQQATFDRLVIDAIDRESPRLRNTINTLYASELAAVHSSDEKIDELGQRMSWLDGKQKETDEAILKQGQQMTNAIDKLSTVIKDTGEASRMSMEKQGLAVNELTRTVADLQGFLRGIEWARPKQPRRV